MTYIVEFNKDLIVVVLSGCAASTAEQVADRSGLPLVYVRRYS